MLTFLRDESRAPPAIRVGALNTYMPPSTAVGGACRYKSGEVSAQSGNCKELLARAIHRLDPNRQQRPFVPVNCAAINPGLMESDILGHRRGGFTAAERGRDRFAGRRIAWRNAGVCAASERNFTVHSKACPAVSIHPENRRAGL